MSLQFVSHREIAFRQLLGMLRAPPFAMLSYYSNLFISAKFVLGDQPQKIRYLDKEVRRVECMVGVVKNAESNEIQYNLQKLEKIKSDIIFDLNRITSMFDSANDKQKEELKKTYKEVDKRKKEVDAQEHYLLFKLTPIMDLKMIESYTDNNIDLKSFFKENGRRISQMELTSELDKIKSWVYAEAVEIMPYIRFTKLE